MTGPPGPGVRSRCGLKSFWQQLSKQVLSHSFMHFDIHSNNICRVAATCRKYPVPALKPVRWGRWASKQFAGDTARAKVTGAQRRGLEQITRSRKTHQHRGHMLWGTRTSDMGQEMKQPSEGKTWVCAKLRRHEACSLA